MYSVVSGGFGSMEVITINAKQPINIKETHVACIGYFDGIHKGHMALINETIKLASHKYIPTVICFDNDPHVLMHKISDPRYITPYHERLRRLEACGIKRCFLLHFDEDMMCMSKNEFIEKILNKLNLHTIICGEDFRFAYRGEGNIETLRNQTFQLNVVSEKKYHNTKISSSTIEKLIEEGNMKECYEQLGRYYSIKGIVIHGAHVGSTKLGFPTANLQMDEDYLIPKKGVYAGSVKIDNETYKAMINVGNNPTMNYQMNTSIEAHIIDFDRDIYGQNITFYFHDYMREEKKFNSLEELIEQLKYDIQFVRNL